MDLKQIAALDQKQRAISGGVRWNASELSMIRKRDELNDGVSDAYGVAGFSRI